VFIEQASAGLPTMGGLDFDSRLAKLVRSQLGIHETWTDEQKIDFRLQIELAKIRLSETSETTVRVPSGSSVPVSREQYEREIRGLIDESRVPLERVLRDINAGPGSFDAVVLVGGTCRIPAVRKFVRDVLGVEPDISVNPMTAVAEGAAIAAAILSGATDKYDFFVSTEHALGTFALSSRTKNLEFSTIIPRNHKLPAQAQDSYRPVHEDQENVKIEVVEGDPDAIDPDYTVLKSWEVPLNLENGARVESFMLRYEWDVSGILHVSAVDEVSGVTILEDDISYGIAEDKKKLAQIASRAKKAISSGTLNDDSVAQVEDVEAADLVAKALTKVVPFLDGEEADALVKLVRRVEATSGAELANAKVDLRRALAEYSYLL
jgi:molecular chaperone DnaK